MRNSAKSRSCCSGYQLTVHIGPGPAVDADHPAHDDLRIMLDGLRVEPRLRGVGKSAEACRNLGALGPMTHDVAAGPAAGDEQQCIDHDRFSRAGLAGQRREAGAEVEFGLIDDDEIPKLQMREHYSPPLP